MKEPLLHRRAFITRSLSALGAWLAVHQASLAQTGKKIQILGAYGTPKTFWEKGKRLKDYGINALFVHSGSIDDALVRRAREEVACKAGLPLVGVCGSSLIFRINCRRPSYNAGLRYKCLRSSHEGTHWNNLANLARIWKYSCD